MPTAVFYTLGCRLNQTESAIMARSLENAGYRIVENGQQADLCVLNTCTVTNRSDSKCRRSIRGIVKNNPHALIAVVGCFSQLESERIRNLGGVDIILGNREKLHLSRYVERAKKSREPIVEVGAISGNSFSIDTIGQHRNSTRANLKIQDGCNFRCSFCIIPSARGRSRSREIDNIRQEAWTLEAAGVKELVLTGVNVGTFWMGDTDIVALLELFEEMEGIRRVRISSIEPTTVGTEIFPLMQSKGSKLVPHLHLPLQSGCDRILKAMRRRYAAAEYAAYVEEAKRNVPNFCIGSDVIVGFPGETEEMFEETVRLLRCLPLHYFHVFPYAERRGTKSAEMADRVPGDAISRRAAVLRNLSEQKKAAFVDGFVGKSLEVLFEGNAKGDIWSGYTENYIRVAVESTTPLQNQLLEVTITESKNGQAVGRIN